MLFEIRAANRLHMNADSGIRSVLFSIYSLNSIDQSRLSLSWIWLQTVCVESKQGRTHWPKCNLGTHHLMMIYYPVFHTKRGKVRKAKQFKIIPI